MRGGSRNPHAGHANIFHLTSVGGWRAPIGLGNRTVDGNPWIKCVARIYLHAQMIGRDGKWSIVEVSLNNHFVTRLKDVSIGNYLDQDFQRLRSPVMENEPLW